MAGHSEAVTIRDVASRAGVALSSVSRVLTGHPDVSDALRARVEKAIEELGYEPNFLARSMRKGVTETVGFVLRDIGNPLFAQAASACEQRLRSQGYSMLVLNSGAGVETEASNLLLLRQRRVAGVIASLVSERAPGTVKALHRLNVPIVLLDREVEGLSAGAVLTDHYTGTRQAVEDLISRGHTRIALITGEPEVRSTRERIRGYRAAFRASKVAADPRFLVSGSFEAEFATAEVIRLFSHDDPPTAILGGGIATTAGTLRALRQLRLKVNRDVAVVALDEWPLFDVSELGLPSVARDGQAMGQTAAQLLLDMLDGADPRVVTLETEFRPRGRLTRRTTP